jgi:hypothetical protein
MKLETVLAIVVKRTKERQPLYVIPMEVRNENMSGNWTPVELVSQRLSQNPKAGTTIEDVEIVPDAHFHAGGIASIAHIFGLRSRRRPANSPELDPHKPPQPMMAKLSSSAAPSNPSIHSVVTGGYSSVAGYSPYNGRYDPAERV